MYDTIAFGTSILTLIEAYFQALQGKKVAIVEKSELLGGSWQIYDCLGFKGVEFGCHILAPTGNNG